MQKRMKPAAPGHSRPNVARILARVCAFWRGAGIAGCGSRCAHPRAGLRLWARCWHCRLRPRAARIFAQACATTMQFSGGTPRCAARIFAWVCAAAASSCARKPASGRSGFNHVCRGALLLARASQQVAAAVSTMFAVERFFCARKPASGRRGFNHVRQGTLLLRCARASKQV